jgi:septal ring-binding cell division protein DamX/type II secretory pathway predicted ATPase ExeA
MDTETWQRLELERDPFPHTGPDDLFLQTPGLSQRLSLFVQLVQSSDLTLLLLGDPGVGKSTFAARAPSQLDESWRVLNWHAFRGAAPGDMLQVLTHGFAVTPGDSADELTFESLIDHLQALRASGHNSLLIVDDADDLGDPELQMLMHLSANSPLRLALAGTATLAERLTSSPNGGSDAGFAHRISLSELTLPQTADYMQARLTRSGWEGVNPFNAEVCTSVFEESHGNPGAIHRAAAAVLEDIPLEPLPSPPNLERDEAHPRMDPVRMDPSQVRARLTTHAPIQPRITLHSRRHRVPSMRTLGFIGIGVVVFAGLVFALLRDPSEPSEPLPTDTDIAHISPDSNDAAPNLQPALIEPPPAPQSTSTSSDLPLAPPARPTAVLAKPGRALPPGPVVLAPADSTATPNARSAVTPSATASPRPRARPARLVGPDPSEIRAAIAAAARAAEESVPARSTLASAPDADASAAAVTDTLINGAAADPAVAASGRAQPTVTLAGSFPRPRFLQRRRRGEPALDTVATTPPSSGGVAVEERSIPSPPTVPARVSTTITAATSEDPRAPEPVAPAIWLSPVNAERYTVQLIVLGAVDKADEFISLYSLRDALVVALRTPDSKPLFAVIDGLHDARDDALAAIRRLPPGVRQERPWPRRIGAILNMAVSVRAPRR